MCLCFIHTNYWLMTIHFLFASWRFCLVERELRNVTFRTYYK